MPSFPREQEGDDEEPTEDEQEDPSGVHAEGESEDQGKSEVPSEKQQKPEEVKRKLSETFCYNYEDIRSRPFVTENSEIPINLLTLKYSFGYESTRTVNLQMMDSQKLLYIAGNQVVIQDLKTKSQRYLRSSSGGGIGFIAAHPTKQYFAVGEKGKKPNLIIYKYPSLRPYRILQGGTEKAYVFGDFNRAGTLLATVGSSPDYMLTIWDWKQEEIVLRSKAFAQDVYKVRFSAENEEHLTTSGSGHIKFWKMALTLTGLKLQGALGRFGKTAVSDILGFVELPDGKVVSGTEWGNLLLWEGGLIKVELCREGHQPCHHGPVNQLVLEEGELISVGKDGFIRVWNFEIIDGADSVDETGLLEVEPMNELCVGKNVSLNFMSKVQDQGRTVWYAQDTNGAIWKLDLTFSNMTHDPECLCTFHSGRVEAISVSPITYLMATTALDRSVRIYDFSSHTELSEIKFKQGGTALTWAPYVVNPAGGLVAVGFEDGVVRIIEVYDPKLLPGRAEQASTEKAEINLKQAFKPHSAAVTALAYERNGDVFATGSKDKTVFFFAAKDEYKPVGFICVPGPVQALQWSPPSHEKSTLLILCENGFAVQVPAPLPEEQDTVTTYQIKNLPMQYFHFYSIKSRIKLEEEIARREEKKKEKERARLQWIKEQKEMGLEIEQEPEQEPEEEPLPPLYIPEEPSPILCGFYSTPGKFWLSLGGYDSGFLYHCEFSHDHEEDPENRKDEPFEVIPIEDTDNNPIHQISFCASSPLMFFGMQDGSVRVYPLPKKDLSVNTLKKYWSLNVHDNDDGQIQGICSSYDGRFLITCGGDGNIFTFDILSTEDVPLERKAEIPFPRIGLEKEKAAEDIEDPDAYNIEEVKQKKESERIMKEAEEKKNKKRQEIIALRHDFVFLLQKNQELPKHMQLRREEYEMDHRIFEELDRQKAQRIQSVQKELAWEHEKQLTGLQKLQKQFRDSLEFSVVVHAIQSNHQISTYKLLPVPEKYSQDKEQVGSKWKVLKDKWRALKQAEAAKKMEITTDSRHIHSDIRIFVDEAEELKMPDVQKPTARYIEMKREKIRRIVEKSDKIKAKLIKRKAQWDELYKSKPRNDYENPRDAEEIREERENMGCYQLKTASDYKLPEHKYVNTEKKMMQLASLKELIHRKKANMNKEIVSLRDLKVSIIDEIKCLVKELKSIQASLDLSERLPLPLIPRLHPDEVPEKKFECNSDILQRFKEELAKAKPQEQLEGSASFRAFRRGFIPAPSVEETDPMAQAADTHPVNTASSVGTEQQKVFEIEKAEPTEIELEILKREKIKNLYFQETLIKKINMLVINFDAELRLLRHKKMKMDVQMKNADLRCITCCEELLILKKLEKHEDFLQEQIYALISEEEAIQLELKSCLAQMEDKKCEILKLRECKKALYANFQASLGEDNEFSHFLTKVLKKKIECVEKKEVEGEADEEDESEGEDDEESDLKPGEENSGSEDEVFDDSVCPDGCDEALFLNTLQLRQQRLDIEKALAEEKKIAADLRKKYNALAEKAKEVETSLDTTKRDLEIFQWEKLQKLNELNVVVPLKLHQVQCLVDGEMPSDFSQALVFTSQSLEYLQKRVVDLRNEKTVQREHYKKAREKHRQLVQDKKEMEKEIRRLEEKCNQLMMEKFGRLVDFEAVQAHSVNIPMEDMKVKIMEKEYKHYLELKKWEERILELQQMLMKVTKENTTKLLQLDEFCQEKHQLETKLDSLPNDLGAEFQGTQTTDMKERDRLGSRLMRTADDIARLREEINLVRRGGY
ncbi:cilia- and flagella-associated protein 44 isoform X1 [Manacus candei]|uniref:cilia- and flagella-associated protein 44 isoform X1 n=2 Tax=Manacus candei TaxID=415023 RepID=UPI002227FA41|nr:cilia- and flagella-associated protein 44 isoform X1 [Manacus candei]